MSLRVHCSVLTWRRVLRHIRDPRGRLRALPGDIITIIGQYVAPELYADYSYPPAYRCIANIHGHEGHVAGDHLLYVSPTAYELTLFIADVASDNVDTRPCSSYYVHVLPDRVLYCNEANKYVACKKSDMTTIHTSNREWPHHLITPNGETYEYLGPSAIINVNSAITTNTTAVTIDTVAVYDGIVYCRDTTGRLILLIGHCIVGNIPMTNQIQVAHFGSMIITYHKRPILHLTLHDHRSGAKLYELPLPPDCTNVIVTVDGGQIIVASRTHIHYYAFRPGHVCRALPKKSQLVAQAIGRCRHKFADDRCRFCGLPQMAYY